MRIALFTETFLPKVDGIVTRLKHTVEHLQKQGNQVLVFCPEGGLKEYQGAMINGIHGIPLPLYPELKLAIPTPSINFALKKFNPDLVHVVNPAVLGLGGIYYAKKLRIPLVASYHTHLPQYLHHYNLGALEGLLWEGLKLVHNQAQLNLCTSTAMVNELVSHGIERVDLWQKGVDTDTFNTGCVCEKMRDRLSKGHPDAPLLESIPGARLAIVGNGPAKEELEGLFAGMNTNFVGYLHGQDLASAYASADAFIFPSSTETLGLVLLEAMAAGCPVVAARRGGIPDIVTDGVNGYMFDPDDSQGAIEATQRLLAQKDERDVLRQNARLEAEKWSWASATKQLENFYQGVLSNNNIYEKVA
jgi:glycosyltransferase involved in cell wall biosynthesis